MKTNYFIKYQTKKRIYIIERYYGSNYNIKINWKKKGE
jgi:hypothetical protein